MHLVQKVLLLFSLLGYYGAAEVTRPYHLDYLDVETMEYYLTAPQEDFDVAVMFYAQWCSNCHSFAPLWDQISRIHQAGTEQSNLIMGLFDCEADTAHSQVCNKAGVKHYPTISFFSLSGQKYSLRKPRHGTHFGGNWKYADGVYDWLKTMGGLSNWHRLGWGKKLRSLFFGKRTKPKDKKLPQGIPAQGSVSPASAGAGAGTSSGTASFASATGATSSTSGAATEKQVQELEAQVKEYSEVAVRSSVLLDAVLFPLSTGSYEMETDNNKNATDVFALMADTNGWTNTDNVDKVLRACVMDISLDYCSRLSNYLTNDWVSKQVGLESLTDEVVNAFTTFLNQSLPESEPYCLLVEDCILSDYAKEECRPAECPFKDPAACRYISACLAPDLQIEYASALNLSAGDGTSTATADSTSSSSSDTADSTTTTSSSKPKGGWGL